MVHCRLDQLVPAQACPVVLVIGVVHNDRSLYNGGNGDAILQQLDHAEQTLDALDPIRQLSRLVPEVPDPMPDDLKPFLGGWSSHGPDSSHW